MEVAVQSVPRRPANRSRFATRARLAAPLTGETRKGHYTHLSVCPGDLSVMGMFRSVDLLLRCCVYPNPCARLTIFLRQIAASFVTVTERKERHDNVYHSRSESSRGEDEKCSGRPQNGQSRRTELPGCGIKVCE